jgi:hypothetical protein
MKKIICLLLAAVPFRHVFSQELYVYAEPASSIPAGAIIAKMKADGGGMADRTGLRLTPEATFGISKKWMLRSGTSFSNMYTGNMGWESLFVYGKYRFLSKDGVHKHFRMAAFAEMAYSRNPYTYDEVGLGGDRSGAQAGLVVTQLIHKLAVSITVSHTQATDRSRWDKIMYHPARTYEALNYSLSAGYLLLPAVYKSYKQLNLNFYTELLTQQTIDRRTFYTDLAPSLQAIINSNTKINAGYRFQLNGNQHRPLTRSFTLSAEHTFFGAIGKSKKR